MKLTLRPYQAEAISAVHEFWRGEGGNPLVVLPTGAGKSLVIADLVRGLLDAFPQMRIGMVTHVKELIDQNAQELWRLWPGAPIGIYSAGLGRRDTRAQVLFMGIQSVHKKADVLGGFDLLLIDEAHLIPRNTTTMYGRFIGDCLDINPNMSVCGMTATPYRLDSGRLDRGKDRLFDKVVYEANVRDLIADGYLSNLISKATEARIDTSNVHIRAGEFKADELEAAALNIVESAVAEIIEWGTKENRQGWLAFCTGVDHATQVRDLMRQNGISCESVTGETPKGDRDRIIQSYKARKIKCLTSVGVLTTGFNAPHVDLIALLRPTLSTGLFCLDAETEILTSHGWKSMGEINVGDTAPSLDTETGKGKWSRIIGLIERPMEDSEMWVEYSAPRANFRVTSNHRMIFATKRDKENAWDYQIKSALEMSLVKNGVRMPTAVEIDQSGVPLTDAELYFIGMVMTDGTVSSHQIQIYQSERHPEIIDRIEKSLEECNFAFVKRQTFGSNIGKTGIGPDGQEIVERHRRWTWTISKGKPRNGDNYSKTAFKENEFQKTGWSHLSPWLDKDFAQPLMSLSKSQFITLLTAIDDGDGYKIAKYKSCDWSPKSWKICSARKIFIERIQMLSAIHGMTCHVRWEHKNRKRPIAMATITPKDWRSVGGCGKRPQITVTPATKEKVWCVETETGTIITRRHGKVTVMGNCQMVGRGLRNAPGKDDCRVLDFAGNAVRHGPVDDVRPRSEKGGGSFEGEEKVKPDTVQAKECPKCQTLVGLATMTCPTCEHEWPKPEPRHEAEASADAPILSTEKIKPRWLEVKDTSFHLHEKIGAPTSLRVEYDTGLQIHKEWLCFEHRGGAKGRAGMVWRRMGGGLPVPQTSLEGMRRQGELRTVTAISVRRQKPGSKYFNVVDRQYVDAKALEAAE